MSISSDTIYLSIAGFNIKINFTQAVLTPNEKENINALNNYFGGFLLKKKPMKIDFSIHFIKTNHFYILHKKNNLKFIAFFTRLKKKEITTFYHISLTQFEAILSIILNELLHNSGFILHASAVSQGERAFIFTGRPGAGKSTIMKLLSIKYHPIADDSIIIKKENGQYYAYQTPFTEKEDWIKRRLNKYRIDKIFFLRKANYFKTLKIDDQRYIAKRIMKQFFTEREYLIKQTKLLLDFISKNPFFYFLYFRNDDSLIEHFKTNQHDFTSHPGSTKQPTQPLIH